MRIFTHHNMTSKKLHKQRVNISVDPSVHERFTQYAERTNQTVSGVLNEVMDIFCQKGDGRNMNSPITQYLRQRLLAEDSSDFQRVVRKLMLDTELKEIPGDNTDPANIVNIPIERRSEWVGVVGKTKIGVRLAFELSREPDITLGRTLLFRGIHKCERVLMVVPYRLAIPSHVLAAAVQSGLEVVGVDLLETALHTRSRREPVTPSSDPRQSASDKALIEHLKKNV